MSREFRATLLIAVACLILGAPWILAAPSEMGGIYLPLVFSEPPTPTPIPPTATPTRTPTAMPTIIVATPTNTPIPPTPTRDPNQCAAEYPTVCIPPPPPDLNCSDIPYRNFTVLPPDRHHFDTDHDGIGCEQ